MSLLMFHSEGIHEGGQWLGTILCLRCVACHPRTLMSLLAGERVVKLDRESATTISCFCPPTAAGGRMEI